MAFVSTFFILYLFEIQLLIWIFKTLKSWNLGKSQRKFVWHHLEWNFIPRVQMSLNNLEITCILNRIPLILCFSIFFQTPQLLHWVYYKFIFPLSPSMTIPMQSLWDHISVKSKCIRTIVEFEIVLLCFSIANLFSLFHK